MLTYTFHGDRGCFRVAFVFGIIGDFQKYIIHGTILNTITFDHIFRFHHIELS